MGYLLTQMFFYLLGAFLLGLFMGWILWGRLRSRISELEADNSRLSNENNGLKPELEACGANRAELERRLRETEAEFAELRSRPARTATATQAPAQLISMPEKEAPKEPAKKQAPKKAPAPKKAAAAPTKPDDLRRMIGIGPVNERLLHKAGVTTFAQIAKWKAADVKRIEEILQFDGRIARERWIEQAKLLAAGKDEEFLRAFPGAGGSGNT